MAGSGVICRRWKRALVERDRWARDFGPELPGPLTKKAEYIPGGRRDLCFTGEEPARSQLCCTSGKASSLLGSRTWRHPH